MKTQLKDSAHPVARVLYLAAASLLCGVLGLLLTDLFVALATGCYAALLFTERDRRIFSWITPVLFAGICPFFGWYALIYAVVLAGGGWLLCRFYLMDRARSECVAFLCVLFGAAIVLSQMQAASLSGHAFSVSGILEALRASAAKVKDTLMEGLENYPGVTEKMLADFSDGADALAEYILSLFFSLIALMAFLCAGIACKIFSCVVRRVSLYPSYIGAYRFEVSNLFAYAYFVVFALNTFAMGTTGVFAATVGNLLCILTGVFAYLGLCALLRMIRRAPRRAPASVALVLMILFGGWFGVMVLSGVGALSTLVKNRRTPADPPSNGGTDK